MDLRSPSATSCPKAVSGPCPRAQPFPVLWFKTSPGHHWHVYANPLAFLNAKAFEPGTEATYGIKNWGCTSGPNPSRRSVPLGRPYLGISLPRGAEDGLKPLRKRGMGRRSL